MGRATSDRLYLSNGIFISIHALRGEGDLNLFQWNYIIDGISIHALRGEGDNRENSYTDKEKRFQSTPSVGRATLVVSVFIIKILHFNPRPPWGGRRYQREICLWYCNFNPRPPWGGRLFVLSWKDDGVGEFQSTPSVGRATETL